MFATLNLQLTLTTTTLEPTGEPLDASSALKPGKESGFLPFSQMLGMSTIAALSQDSSGGEFLPDTGKPLPPLRPPQLVDDPMSPREIVDDLRNPLQLKMPVRPAMPIDPKASSALDPDMEMEIEIEVAYLPSEIMVAEPVHVPLLPMQIIPGADRWPTQIGPSEQSPEAAGRLGADALAAARPLQTLIPEVNSALTTPIQNLVTPAGNGTAVLPNTDGLVRDRIMQATQQQAPVAVATVADGTIEGTHEELLAPLARSVGAVTTVQRPDFRVAGLSSTQATTPAHLSPAISPFANETTLIRQEPLLEAISTPVRDAAWGQKLGEQLVTLTGNQVKTAEIKLTPADLGPLRVQISIDEGTANISFHAQSAVTREAIEQALPRLREMMAESGLSLGQADVSEQDVAEGKQERDLGSTAGADERGDGPAEGEHLERRKTVTSNNLLDTFV